MLQTSHFGLILRIFFKLEYIKLSNSSLLLPNINAKLQCFRSKGIYDYMNHSIVVDSRIFGQESLKTQYNLKIYQCVFKGYICTKLKHKFNPSKFFYSSLSSTNCLGLPFLDQKPTIILHFPQTKHLTIAVNHWIFTMCWTFAYIASDPPNHPAINMGKLGFSKLKLRHRCI